MAEMEAHESGDDWLKGFPIRKIELLQWLISVKNMADTKEAELKNRLPICATLLEGVIGRGKVEVDDTIFKVIAKQGVNVEIDEAMLNQMADDNELTPDDLACFSWKLKISDAIHKIPKTSNVWKALTLTPARPTLKVTRKDEDGDSDD